MSEKLVDLALPTSGVVVKIRRVPTLLLDDFWRSIPPAPKPPMEEVDYGDHKKLEPNPAHPDYKGALERYDYDLGLRMIEFAVEFGVECDVDQAAVEKVRAWARKAGLEITGTDRAIYVTRVLAQAEDLRAIRGAVFSRVQPSEEEIDRKVDSFQGEVPGP